MSTFGKCECGCGGDTRFVRSKPNRFIVGHSGFPQTGERGAAPGLRHGMARHGAVRPEFWAFTCAQARCINPKNPGFKHYGARGIRFLFESFEQFFAEIGPRPTPQHSLDRKDNDGHYAPGNVRWATRREQRLNQRWHYVSPKAGLL